MKYLSAFFSFFWFLFLFPTDSMHAQKVCMVPPLDLDRPEPLQAFGDAGKFWKKDTFYVFFIDFPEEERLYKKIMYRANKWGRRLSDVRFIRTLEREKADCRITLRPGGSWSYVGIDNRYIPIDQATMQLGWAIGATDKELDRVVIHEFGHFLGLDHEHQNPTAQIKWNREQVYLDYVGWSRQQVDRNLFFKYSVAKTNYTFYDPKSIMHYPIPAKHTLDGYSVGWNFKLSDTDKIFIRNMYGCKLCSP